MTASADSPAELETYRPFSRAAAVVVGAGMGVLVPAIVVRLGFGPHGIIEAFFGAVVVVLALVDLRERRIPNRIVVPATLLVLAAQIARSPSHAPEWILASLGAALVLLLPNILNRNAIGLGDVKMAMLMGAALGKAVLTALLLGCLGMFPYAIWLVFRRGISGARGTAVPFGPFLAFGAIATLLLG
jgi:leader peptidase (prepilin peptidase) / N-methyltransferase